MPAPIVPSPLPPSVSAVAVRDVTAFARALVAAARSQQMYTPHHPNAVAAAERCRATLPAVAAHEGLVIGVSPEALFVNGEPIPVDPRVREAAALLNDHDILRLRVFAQPGTVAFGNFLMLLSFEPEAMRLRGGPARIWEQYNHPWLVIDQMDFDVLLAGAADGALAVSGRAAPTPAEQARGFERDQTWQSIVRSMADGRGAFDLSAERRLLDIAQSPDAIHALASDAADAQEAPGAAREAAKAAAILMTFQRLSSFVELQAPAELARAHANIARAAAKTDPELLMRAVGDAAESGLGVDVVRAIGSQFDDEKVANLLAVALAAEGKASARMAAALNTLTPDAGRQGRVLRLARSRPASVETDGADVSSLWSALERFLEGPADAAYVSQLYGESLEQAEARTNRVRLDAPPKLDEWVRSVSPESVRTLSVTVLLDLFAIERRPDLLLETAKDMAVLTDDLLLAGDASEALRVVDALLSASTGSDPERAVAGSGGLADIRRCPGMREIVLNAAELDLGELDALTRVFAALGPSMSGLLVDAWTTLPPGLARERTEGLLTAFHEHAFEAINQAMERAAPDHVRDLVRIVVRIGGVRAVTTLLGWTRSPRLDLTRAAIHGLVAMEEPTAVQAVSALLRTGDRQTRATCIDAVASSHHRNAGRLLASALADTDPIGRDHVLALRLLTALRLAGDAGAVPAILGAAKRRSWVAWKRTGAVSKAAVSVLGGLHCAEARAALEEAAATGHGSLRRAARAALKGGG